MFKHVAILMLLVTTGCVPVIMSPIPATSPLDDRLWVEVYNHSDYDLLTVESRGVVVVGRRADGSTAYGLRRGETFEFPLVSFRQYEEYNIRIIGWRCAGEWDFQNMGSCQQAAYQLETVHVPYSNRGGYRRVIEVLQLNRRVTGVRY